MQKSELINILNNKYDFEKWRSIIGFVFPDVRFENVEVHLAQTSNNIKSIHQKGEIKLSDGKRIILLEAGINRTEKTKTGFQDLVTRFIDQCGNHAILVFYISADESHYRLSLICSGSVGRRYTYMLGKNEPCVTAANRLIELAEKKHQCQLQDVIDAFSVENLNDEFFTKYKEQFCVFNNYLAEDEHIRYNIFEINRNEQPAERTANELPIRDFTKKLLGRLVFLYFIQRKGWMGVPAPASGKAVIWKDGYTDFIHRLFKEAHHQSKFHSKYLTALFYNTLNNEHRERFVFLVDGKSPFSGSAHRSVPFLNGGLFNDDFPKGNSIDFPAHLFESLVEFLDQYNFIIDENTADDCEVGIDPEMLGHIFENLLEDNRDKGTYYTPKEVVHYMSRQCIIQYLKHNLNGDSCDIETFIKSNTVSDNIKQHHCKIERLLQEVKICDPAIGSGAFSLGLLQVIYTALHNLHNAIRPAEKFNKANVIKDIIQNCIYGVDIEHGAVEIARLRFWLALVVAEDVPQSLPNLDYKIIQGNSLVGRHFEEVLDKGKFDIIIGNPPYIKEYTNKSAFDGIRDSPYYMGKMDIWYYFASLCVDMLKDDGGIQCFIAQNNWITSAGAAKFRNKILQETQMLSFTDFGNYKVFQSAGIQTMIYVLKKMAAIPARYTTNYARLLVNNIDRTFLDYFLQSDTNAQHENFEKLPFEFVPANYLNGYITFANNLNDSILKKIVSNKHIKLADKEVAQGIVPNPDVVNTRNIKRYSEPAAQENKIKVGDGVFVVKKGKFDDVKAVEKKYLKPIFEPSEVQRYKFVDNYETEIIYITRGNYKDDAPTLLKHLSRYKKIMEERRENQNGRLDYFHLHWPRDEYYFEQGEKILSVRKCGRPTFIYTTSPAYVMMAFNIIKTSRVNLKYLTALLNSRLVAFWLRNKGKMQGNNYQVDKGPLLEIPIVLTDKQHILSTLVDYILLVHQPRKEQLIKYIGNDLIIHAFEEVIDQAFYELYFGNEPEMQELQVLKYLEDIKPVTEKFTHEDIKTVVGFYHWLQEQKNPVRTALLKANIVSRDIIGVINSAVS